MKVRFAAVARDDLDDILATVHRESPLGARRIRQRVRELELALADRPRPGRPTADPRIQVVPLVSQPYLLFYEVRETEVVIIGIKHGARDPSTMPGAPDPGDD